MENFRASFCIGLIKIIRANWCQRFPRLEAKVKNDERPDCPPVRRAQDGQPARVELFATFQDFRCQRNFNNARRPVPASASVEGSGTGVPLMKTLS